LTKYKTNFPKNGAKVNSPVSHPHHKWPLETSLSAVTISEIMSAATKATLKNKGMASILTRWKVQLPEMKNKINILLAKFRSPSCWHLEIC
jgi:hypothetical protein